MHSTTHLWADRNSPRLLGKGSVDGNVMVDIGVENCAVTIHGTPEQIAAWADQVKLHTVSKIKKHIPAVRM